jgi:hypothetical protein
MSEQENIAGKMRLDPDDLEVDSLSMEDLEAVAGGQDAIAVVGDSNGCPQSYTCPGSYTCPASYTCPQSYTCPN